MPTGSGKTKHLKLEFCNITKSSAIRLEIFKTALYRWQQNQQNNNKAIDGSAVLQRFSSHYTKLIIDATMIHHHTNICKNEAEYIDMKSNGFWHSS